jgi:hypothetical protein
MTKWLLTVGLVLAFVFGFTRDAAAQGRCPYGPTAGTIEAGDAAQNGRLQNGQASTCANNKPAPQTLLTSTGLTFRYDSYPFKNRSSTAQCVTVTLTTTAGTAQSTAYLGAFNPANLQANYLGDSGANSTANTIMYSFNVPALADFAVVVNEIGTAGATYSLSVGGCGTIVVTSITPNAGPSLGGTDVTIKGSGFLAGAGVTIGSAATMVVVVNDTTITARTAASTDGPKDVVVTNSDATTATLTNGFTYVPLTGTTLTLASSANPSVFGQNVTFTATATAAAGTPTGTITFFDGATNIGTGMLNNLGVATLSKANFTVGTHPITAQYPANATFAASTSAPVSQVVTKANTTTTLISSDNPAVAGASVTFTASVAAVAPGAGTPAGTITFMDGTTMLGTPVVIGNTGLAMFVTTTLTVGTHSITATYSGNDDFATSASTVLTQTITAAVDAGSSGSSGTSGTSGASGTSGTSGASGASGGASGTSGTSGTPVTPSPTPTPTPEAESDDGCGCHEAKSSSSSLALFGFTLLALAVMARRNKRKQK